MLTKSRKRYGAPRVHQELRANGTRIAKHRVAPCLRDDQLVARPRRRFVRTTESRHADPIAPNLVPRTLTVAAQPTLDRVWVSAMT